MRSGCAAARPQTQGESPVSPHVAFVQSRKDATVAACPLWVTGSHVATGRPTRPPLPRQGHGCRSARSTRAAARRPGLALTPGPPLWRVAPRRLTGSRLQSRRLTVSREGFILQQTWEPLWKFW